MIAVTDQLGRTITLTKLPIRIISLVPSQTELLYYLGLDAEIAGITKFCTHPAGKTTDKLKVGGTKNLDIQLIRSINPDLIIANKEENERLQLEGLMADYPTYISDPHNLATALQLILDIGLMVGRKAQAVALSQLIQVEFSHLEPPSIKLRVAYLIWRKPYMVAGKGTFIDDMLTRCGFTNVIDQERYPQITVELLQSKKLDLILLSSEPYPFKLKHADELATLIPGVPVKLVDGEMFSWYGSRLLQSAKYFISLTDSLKGL